ncbi:amidohydrolase [Myxococcota bacterium]|nr:amidohydrolase [Myxococcota bacterium]
MSASTPHLFDVDNHYYEPRDCFTRHLDPRHRANSIQVRREGDNERIWVGDEPCRWIDELFGFDRNARPGSLARQLREEFSVGPRDYEEDMQPEYRDRDARLALLDQQGIHGTFLFPSLGVCVEPYMAANVEQTYANLHAFNRWLEEDWGFAYRDRLFSAPMISLLDEKRATTQVEDLLQRGARVVCLKAGPANGRSPADPHFDALWARLEEARAVVAIHSGNAGYTGMLSAHWGDDPNPAAHRMSALQWITCFADRPIMDTLSALVLQNLFGRFPGLRILSVENGSLWVPYLMATLDRMVGMAHNGPWPGGRLSERPSEIFAKHVWVSPFPYDDPEMLVSAIGVNRVTFGSDFPHPEGMEEPAHYARRLSSFSSEDQNRILFENGRELSTP